MHGPDASVISKQEPIGKTTQNVVHSHPKRVMENETDSQYEMDHTIIEVAIVFGLFLVLLVCGAFIEPDPIPPHKKYKMSQRVNLPVECDNLCSNFLINDLINHTFKQNTVHNYLRSHAKYQADIISLEWKNDKVYYTYKFKDESQLNIVYDPVVDMLSYTENKVNK